MWLNHEGCQLALCQPNSNKKRRWCNGIMRDSHSRDPGSIPGRRKIYLLFFLSFFGTSLQFLKQ